MIEAPERVVLDLPDLNAAVPCEEVVPHLFFSWSGDPCTFVASLRVTWAHPRHPEGLWHESWIVCRPCFAAMGQAFGGHAVDVHEL